MSRTLPRVLAAIPLLAALAGAARAQTISAGSIPASPNFGFNPSPVAITAVDLTAPATGSGDMTTATFVWSLAPCPGTVKIKFFRRSGDTLLFLAERGPFDVNTTTQAVALSPAVSVQAGDLVGIARVAGCGSPVGLSPGGAPGLVAYGADITFSVSISSGTAAANSTLAVLATGTAVSGPPSTLAGIIPVVISSPGLLGANFHTAVQLYNPSMTIETGSIVFHAQGAAGPASDPTMAYSINPGQTIFFPDVLTSLGQTGIGSLDLITTTGSAPVASVRVYNDAGAAGTTGFTEHGLKPSEALSAGSRGALIGPFDPFSFRYNIGVRTLSAGATISITVRDAAGNTLRTLMRSYPSNFFQQTDVTSFLGGLILAANQTITVDVVSGSLFVYGATADDRTNDPALDFAQSVPL
jgi:hypothetical protein